MAQSLNKIQIIGNLGRDPEMKYNPSGSAKTTFSVATSRSWKNKQTDEWEEETEWHNVVVWGQAAERAAEKLRKGKKVYVEGRISTSKWADAKYPEVTHYKAEIIADNFIDLDPKGLGEDSNLGEFQAPAGGFAASAPARQSSSHDPLDDLPF